MSEPNLIYEAPGHVFFCRSADHVLQAAVFAAGCDTCTVAVIFHECPAGNTRPGTYLGGRFRVVAATARRVLRPLWSVLEMPGCTREELNIATWLGDYDVTIHAFSPAADVSLYTRDDIILHDSGDYSRWRVGGQLADAGFEGVHRIMLQSEPDGYDAAKDRKVRVWDFVDALSRLGQDEAREVLSVFGAELPVFSHGDVLYVHQEPDTARYTPAQVDVIHWLVGDLVRDLESCDHRVWFKGHHKRPWAPEGTRQVQPGIPAELLVLADGFGDVRSVSVRSAAVDRLSGRCLGTVHGMPHRTCERINLSASGMVRSRCYEAYLSGLLGIAREMLCVDLLRRWEILFAKALDGRE